MQDGELVCVSVWGDVLVVTVVVGLVGVFFLMVVLLEVSTVGREAAV